MSSSSEARMRRWLKLTAIVFALAAALAAGWAAETQRQYERAVEADARRLGVTTDSIAYPAHWPLDFYQHRLDGLNTPQQAEALLSDADSAVYFLSAVDAGGTPITLTQVFYFTVGPRTNVIQLHYTDASKVSIEGTDWMPDPSTRVSREVALARYQSIREPSSP